MDRGGGSDGDSVSREEHRSRGGSGRGAVPTRWEVKRDERNKKITINKTSGKVTVKKGLKKNWYPVKVAVTNRIGGDAYTQEATFQIRVK